MGRTQHTYRMRLQAIRDRLISLFPDSECKSMYKELWIHAHTLSAPSSTLPYPDTYAIATYCIILEAISNLYKLKEELSEIQASSSRVSSSRST